MRDSGDYRYPAGPASRDPTSPFKFAEKITVAIYASITLPHSLGKVWADALTRSGIGCGGYPSRAFSMVRFILYVSMAFVTAFVGVTWAARGFPVHLSGPISVAPLQPTVDATFGDHSAKDHARKMWEAEHTAQSDKNPKLDKVRLEALQAANAYAMSPCDKTMKSNLIEAVTAYTRAWQEKMDCPRPMNMLMFCGGAKLKEVAATFSTPLDIRVKAALHEAFEQRGIVKADFPADMRFDVLQFAGPGLWSDESPICLPRMRASAGAPQ